MEKRITLMRALMLLAIIYVAGAGLRYDMYSKMIETFDAYGAIPFAKESASHYRYARMIAAGEPVPAIDYQAQYPEGHTVTDDSILEEYVVGYLYKVLPLGGMPLDRFISLFVILFSSLSIIAAYHFCRSCRLKRSSSLAATLLYAVSIPSILRNVGTEFAREHFSLPLIFFHASFFLRAIDGQRDRRSRLTAAVVSALCLGTALASWKLCRFYLLIWAIFMVLQFILRKDYRLLLMPTAVIGGTALLTGLIVPHLQSDLFITSTPMILLYALGVLLFIDWRVKAIDLWLARGAIVASVFAALQLLLPQSGRFGHVYYTTLYQIRFFFQHPQDPALLPPEARLYWVPGYTCPSLYHFLTYFFIPLVAGAYAIMAIAREFIRRKLSTINQFALYAGLATFVSYIFFSRLHVLLMFFLVVFMAWSMEMALARFRRSYVVYALVGLMCLHQIVQAVDGWDPLHVLQTMRIQPVQEEMFLENVANVQDVVLWMKDHTDPQSIALTYWHTSVQVLAYADRTTVLHTFFEDPRMRDKIIGFASALYDDEDSFYAFCRQNEVNYFIYSAKFFFDYTTVGTRFLADRLAVDETSFASQAHFRPEELKHFALRYQNDCFRIYEVIDEGQQKVDSAVDYQPIFDRFYEVKNADEARRAADEISYASYLYYSGLESARHGQAGPALEFLQKALSIVPSLVDAQILMGRVLEGNGMISESIAAYRSALFHNPEGPSAPKIKKTLERLTTSFLVGSYTFDSSNDVSIDSTYGDARLELAKDGTFVLSNPGFQGPGQKPFAIVESGTFAVSASSIDFEVTRQEPPGYDYYYLFRNGPNTLLYDFDQGRLVIKGGSAIGGIISLRWKRSSP